MPDSIDKSKIISSLPSASRNKRKKRIVVDDDSLNQIREESLKQTFPEIKQDNLIIGSDNSAENEDAKTQTSSKDSETDIEPSAKKGNPRKKVVSKPDKKTTKKKDPLENEEKTFTTFSCYLDTVNNVRLVCSVLRKNQYEFVSDAINTYHEHLFKKGKLDSFSQGKKEKNDKPMEFLQTTIKDNQLAKMDALLLGIHKYQFGHDAVVFYFQLLKKKGLIPEPIFELLK